MSRGWDEGSPALGEEPWRELTPRGSWEELVLPAQLIARLREVPELYRQRPPAAGRSSLLLLFGGPSGVGKTSAALALAAEMGRTVLEADVEELVARDPAHAPQLVARLVNHARQLGGVLVLDHADTLLRSRRESADITERAAAPLLRLDRDGARLPGVVIFCAELTHVDEHARVQFDHTFIFPQLDAATRAQLWHRHLPPGHLIPTAEIAYLGQAFRLSAKDIARCCAAAERHVAGRPMTLHDIADQLDAEYEDRLASDWTRAALAEVRVRAARVSVAETARGQHGPSAWAAVAPRPAPAQPANGTRWDPPERPRAAPVGEPALAPRPRRSPIAHPARDARRRQRSGWPSVLGIALIGAIAAIVLGIALSHHTKAQPAAVRTPTASGPSATVIAYRSRLAQALSGLNQSRTRLSRQLASARTPAAQARDAYALAAAHMKTASNLLQIDAGAATDANQNLIASLQRAGDAYSALAQAAQKHDARGYTSAEAAVGEANAAVSGAIERVRRSVG